MQFNNKDYNPAQHDHFPALTVKQPYADNLVAFDVVICFQNYIFNAYNTAGYVK